MIEDDYLFKTKKCVRGLTDLKKNSIFASDKTCLLLLKMCVEQLRQNSFIAAILPTTIITRQC
jgi:hypothetical protein